MSIKFTSKEIIDRIKENMPEINPNIKNYVIHEYDKFYKISSEGFEPILFEKENGFPIFKNYASIPPEECKNGKFIEEVNVNSKKKGG